MSTYDHDRRHVTKELPEPNPLRDPQDRRLPRIRDRRRLRAGEAGDGGGGSGGQQGTSGQAHLRHPSVREAPPPGPLPKAEGEYLDLIWMSSTSLKYFPSPLGRVDAAKPRRVGKGGPAFCVRG